MLLVVQEDVSGIDPGVKCVSIHTNMSSHISESQCLHVMSVQFDTSRSRVVES